MINFSEIDESVLDKTSKKVSVAKADIKELVKRNKLIKKMIDSRHLLNSMVVDLMRLNEGSDETHDFIGNEIRFGDYVLWSPYGQLGWGTPDVGFIVGKEDDGKFKICTSFSFADIDNEDPLKECSIVEVKPNNIIVLSRIDNIKSYEPVGKKLFK
jgi:hypothetical protein